MKDRASMKQYQTANAISEFEAKFPIQNLIPSPILLSALAKAHLLQCSLKSQARPPNLRLRRPNIYSLRSKDCSPTTINSVESAGSTSLRHNVRDAQDIVYHLLN
jgi:hypothetical protein